MGNPIPPIPPPSIRRLNCFWNCLPLMETEIYNGHLVENLRWTRHTFYWVWETLEARRYSFTKLERMDGIDICNPWGLDLKEEVLTNVMLLSYLWIICMHLILLYLGLHNAFSAGVVEDLAKHHWNSRHIWPIVQNVWSADFFEVRTRFSKGALIMHLQMC